MVFLSMGKICSFVLILYSLVLEFLIVGSGMVFVFCCIMTLLYNRLAFGMREKFLVPVVKFLKKSSLEGI